MARAAEQKSKAQPLDRRARRKAANRSRIMASARELFTEEGLSNCGPKDIAELADVGYGTFYSFFNDKYACLGAVIDELLQELLEQCSANLPENAQPAESVESALLQIERFGSEQPMLLRLILSEPLLRVGPEGKAVRTGLSPIENWCRELLAAIGPDLLLAVDIPSFSAQMGGFLTALGMACDQLADEEDMTARVNQQLTPIRESIARSVSLPV